MANYSLILDTKFKPFSYAEMLAPVAAATQAHQAIEEEYGNLSAKASVWENMANEQSDPYAYKMYKTYADDLESRAEQLMRYGLNASSRKGMLDMRARYSKEIVPIETAYKKREALAAEQRKAIAQNPTMLYQRMANTISLDDFIRNPSLDYGEQYSGALLTQQVSNAAGNIAKEARDSEEGRRKLRQILPYQYEMVQQNGFSREAVMKAIMNSLDADKILTGIVEDAITSSGIRGWKNKEALRRAYDYARQGLYNAIGDTKYQMVTDQFNMQNRLNAIQHTRQVKQAEEDRQRLLKMNNPNPTSLYGESEVANMNKDILKELDKWKNKGYINSKGQLTSSGWTAIKNQLLYDISGSAKSKSPYVRGRAYIGRDEDFMKWATEHGVRYDMPKEVSNLNSLGQTFYTYTDPVLRRYEDMTNYYNSTRQKIASGELVTGTPNIDVYRMGIKSNDDSEYILRKTTAALAGGKIYEVGALKVSGTGDNQTVIMKKGKGLSVEDFKDKAKKFPILYVINSPVTNNQLIELSDGTRFIMPKGMIDNINWDNLNLVGDPNNPNSPMGTNQQLGYAGSDYEKASILNQSNSYMGSLFDYTSGTGVNPSDGTIIVR